MIDPDVKRFLDIIERQPDNTFWETRLAGCEYVISNLSKNLRSEQALKEAILLNMKRRGKLPKQYLDVYLGD